ncbi:MAG: sigma-70 family RNA polymerase sigma factor [Chthoniobacteraceae bacterium]|nr:sigma-70 family RNA polymerase sigma factor [Chthoniobacteraceae bacterium]
MMMHDLTEAETLDDVLAENDPPAVLPPPEVEQGAISDEALMEAIAQGNSAALSTLYDRYASILKALTIRVVHDEAEADDLLQEVFMQVWQQARNYSSDKGKPLGWIVTLTRRRAIDRLRKRQAYCRAKDRFEVTTDRQPESWVHNRIEDDIHLEDIRTFLKAKIESLPPFQRQAIEMAFFKGMSQREIAVATETPLGTIKTRLELGLRKLSESIRGIKHKI